MKKIKTEKNTVLDGAISLTIATITVKILGAIYKIPISYILGDEGMGYFNSAYTVYSLFYLLCTAGVPKAIMILNGDAKEGEEIVVTKTALSFFGAFGLFITVAFILLSKPLSRLIGSPNAFNSMITIAPSITFAAVAGVYRGYYSGRSKFGKVAVSQIIEGAGKLVFGLILAIVSKGFSINLNTVSAFAILGATIGCGCALLYLSVNSKKDILYNKPRQNIGTLGKIDIIQKIIKISFPITISALAMSISNIIDLTIVMNRLKNLGLSTIAATSLYGNYTTFATPMFNMLISLFTPITISYMTLMIKNRTSKKELQNVIEDELSISYFLFIPLTIGLCVYSEEVLALLFNDRGVYTGSILLTYLCLSMFFLIPLTITNSALEAVGDAKLPMVVILIGSIIKISSGYIMIGSQSFGILGAPISTLIFYAVSLVLSMIFIQRRQKINPPILKIMFTPLISSFLSIYSVYPIYQYLSLKANRTIMFLVSVILSILLYFIINAISGTLMNKIRLNIKGAKTVKRT